MQSLWLFLPLVAISALAQQHRAPVYASDPLAYHIQTDQGPERFFRFQTSSGQFRKEQRHADGSVTGSYGWVDPNGVLRIFEYIADDLGYRIAKQSLFKVCSLYTWGFKLFATKTNT